MPDPFLIAVAALALSLGISAIRLIDWFVRSDPKAVVRTARYVVIGLAALSTVLLLVLLFRQQWTAAIGLAAVLVLVLAWYGPRMLRSASSLLDLAPEQSVRPADHADVVLAGRVAIDQALVWRSAAVLEEYLRQAAGAKSTFRPQGDGPVAAREPTAAMRTSAPTRCRSRRHWRYWVLLTAREMGRSARRIGGSCKSSTPIAAGRTT
jgi:hypothetical protein